MSEESPTQRQSEQHLEEATQWVQERIDFDAPKEAYRNQVKKFVEELQKLWLKDRMRCTWVQYALRQLLLLAEGMRNRAHAKRISELLNGLGWKRTHKSG